MEEYGVFEAIYLSFFSKSLYRQVAATWGGKAFLYALVVLLLSWIAQVIAYQSHLSTSYAKYSAKLIAEVPVMAITAGKVSTPENRPYFVKDSDDVDTLLVIDTSGQYHSLEQADTNFLITDSSIITKTGNQTKIIQLPNSLTVTLVPMVINEHIKSFVGYLWIIMLPGLAFASFAVMLIKALFYAVLGRIFSALTSARVTYSQCYLLFLVANTPALALATLFDALNIVFPYQFWLIVAVSLTYLFYAILINKPSSEG